ncbi:MAG: hypothetical protein ACRDT1_03375 [Micromonosporaceae bacterium]
MNHAEFHDLVESTIRGMYDRIPERYHEGFEIAFKVGELGPAVEELLGGLQRFDTPITPAERDNLTRVLNYLNEPVSRLDGIAVTYVPSRDSESPP